MTDFMSYFSWYAIDCYQCLCNRLNAANLSTKKHRSLHPKMYYTYVCSVLQYGVKESSFDAGVLWNREKIICSFSFCLAWYLDITGICFNFFNNCAHDVAMIPTDNVLHTFFGYLVVVFLSRLSLRGYHVVAKCCIIQRKHESRVVLLTPWHDSLWYHSLVLTIYFTP